MNQLNLPPLPAGLTGPRTRMPALPPGTPQLLRQLTRPDVSFRELARSLERFPAIAARLIGLANSAWSSPAVTITSLEAACTRMGFDVVRSVSLGLAVGTPFDPRNCPAFDAEQFWCSALMVADTAADLKQASGDWCALDALSVRSAGLLHNLGLLWLAERMPKATDQAIQAANADEDLSLNQAMIEHCGIGYRQAGGHLASQWHLPEVMVSSIVFHGDTSYLGEHAKAACLTGIANDMVTTLCAGDTWIAAGADLGAIPLNDDSIREIAQRTAARLEATRQLARSVFAA
ncbi:MAG: HDOD domain-containing protein [Gammaproteobacteria bacterium]